MVLSNFSSHEVIYKGKNYKTAEHAYHCSRYTDTQIISSIISARSSREAWEISQKYKNFQKQGFERNKVDIMKEILLSKYRQHSDVQEALLGSQWKYLEKQHDWDSFWGTGIQSSGKNMLGKIWMEIREEMIWNS